MVDNSEITRNRILAVSDLALAHKTLVYKIEFLLDPKTRVSKSTKTDTDKSPSYSEWHVADITTCFKHNDAVRDYMTIVNGGNEAGIEYDMKMLCSPNGRDMDHVFAYTAFTAFKGGSEELMKQIFGDILGTYYDKIKRKNCCGENSDHFLETWLFDPTKDAWACVFEAMMKQKLIYNEIADNAETNQIDTIEDEVQKVMEDCHHILKKISLLGHPDTTDEELRKTSVIFRCPEGVIVPASKKQHEKPTDVGEKTCYWMV